MDDASTDTTEAVGGSRRPTPASKPAPAVNRGHIATYNEALAMLTGSCWSRPTTC
jgi:hypothetical protein